MPLKDQIQQDLKTAMFSKNTIALDAIRALKTVIMRYETSGPDRIATDDIIIDLAKKEVKQRKDSIEQFEKGNRPELAEKEEAEIKILEKYIPAQMGEDELKQIISQTLQEIGVKSLQELGKAMSAIMPKVKGKTDGALVNKIVKELLSNS
ncbi:MAG: hypothetical protein UR28_C0011G0009 [Candidatus Peregrinibacteria bacterium GW2011_GWF2_33_10]|nr:MAG: hypothetical protein UR28_C0011G0009 [Candidatus Peregrinibacteria bacterium GW2011_GWF2_33_10]OGJ44286.1 MAG: hypothetical protein A2272_05500 [Candidatus Peregrinibacteria bacterium RIFOXYA12_FULL_33_12]OGJ44661.1 MAG: hypothetical protein A2263_00940 [Candidatus Peregrinibacteria bacterium RIFOXYA2_FULL_33_21]OGJ50395.1 MAG: hypothetical protein A2307_06000 [Candidatus Peregrinibacteria bacterium RIFOXYB2_FULL_33_20]